MLKISLFLFRWLLILIFITLFSVWTSLQNKLTIHWAIGYLSGWCIFIVSFLLALTTIPWLLFSFAFLLYITTYLCVFICNVWPFVLFIVMICISFEFFNHFPINLRLDLLNYQLVNLYLVLALLITCFILEWEYVITAVLHEQSLDPMFDSCIEFSTVLWLCVRYVLRHFSSTRGFIDKILSIFNYVIRGYLL